MRGLIDVRLIAGSWRRHKLAAQQGIDVGEIRAAPADGCF